MKVSIRNVSIVEICTRNHYPLVENWIIVLKNQGFNIFLFVLPEVKELLSEKSIESCSVIKTDLLLNGINEHSDLIIFTSVQNKFLFFYNLNLKKPYLIQVHNANTWFIKKPKLKFKDLIKFYIRKKLIKNAHGVLVCSKNQKKFIEERIALKRNFIEVMPFSLFKEFPIKSTNRLKTIVYPGMISAKRKEYNLFFELAKIFPEINFILLGSPSKNSKEESMLVIQKLETLKLSNIRYFYDFIPLDQYVDIISNASLLFSHLKTKFTKEDYLEYYGISKDSGFSYEMINYSKPGMVNVEFRNIEELDSSTIYFKNLSEAVTSILELKSNPKILRNLNARALSNSKEFLPKNFSEYSFLSSNSL